MTTAHRPTWNSVKGGSEQGGNVLVKPSRQYSSLDMPAHLKLKTRQDGQGSIDEQKQLDFKQELLIKEQQALLAKRGIKEIESDFKEPLPIKRLKVNQSQAKPVLKTPFPQDADENFNDESDDDSDEEESKKSGSSSDNDDDDEDDEDELELLREYAKIKKEREEEQRKRELQKMEELKKKQMEEILRGNPLLNQDEANEISEVYSLKKKWYEESIFKNQARTEPKEKKRFVNDTVRSDFHRKFLNRFIQ